MKSSHQRSWPVLAFALWFLAPGGDANADITYLVDISNPSNLNGTTGGIDFQFNPNSSASLAATAVVTNFSTDGTVGSQVYQNGDASGTLSTTLTFNNSYSIAPNELSYNFTYGSTLSFDVTLSGAALSGGGQSGSIFGFTLYDGSGNAQSPTKNPPTVAIAINTDGSTAGTTYFASGFSGSVTQAVSAVPEPSTMFLGTIGIAGLLGWHHIRRCRAA